MNSKLEAKAIWAGIVAVMAVLVVTAAALTAFGFALFWINKWLGVDSVLEAVLTGVAFGTSVGVLVGWCYTSYQDAYHRVRYRHCHLPGKRDRACPPPPPLGEGS